MSIFHLSDLDDYLINFLDIKTIHILKLVSIKLKSIIINNSIYSNISKIIQQNNISFKDFHIKIIDRASLNGHINILEWFKNSEYEFKYSNYAIDCASYHGHINILEWYKNSKYLVP